MTLFYLYLAAFLGLYLLLSILVIRQRYVTKIGVGGGTDLVIHAALNRAIAAHSNFSQYVPIILIACIVLKESNNLNMDLINGVMGLALLGRAVHAYGISHVEEKLIFRQIGMMLTFISILLLIGFSLTVAF